MWGKTIRLASSGLFILAALSVFAGCSTTIPKSALAMNPQTVEDRQLQTRRFDTTNEAEILSACAALLQDLGFGIDESETRLGLIVATKERDATDAGQVLGAVMMAVLFGVSTPVDDYQKIRASVVTRPVGGRINVRVTFQRAVWNTSGQISRLERLDEPGMYQAFFERLSKAVFLEAHEI
ncbi:MAG: hypothetical protein D6695_02175 [Planctomycetota bacterium]|nr:MAG: hypothetical protein D6695_02175 [Planctomycetota bacterium]